MHDPTQADFDAMDAIIPADGGYTGPTTFAEAREVYAESPHARNDWVRLLADHARIDSLAVTTPDVDHAEAFVLDDVQHIWLDDIATPITAVPEIEARRLASITYIHADEEA